MNESEITRDSAIERIRAALKRRSGKLWSVKGGRGTGWGWITIDAPPARQTWSHRLKAGAAGREDRPIRHGVMKHLNKVCRFSTGQSLTKALAPLRLAEVRGQARVVASLQAFVGAPYATAFLFHGGTGVGKNAVARALAGEFGCDIAGGQLRQQISGFYDLCGATLTEGDVHDRIRGAWYAAMNATGWKVITVSEADKVGGAARAVFLHALDYPPPNAVWVFTTNEVECIDRRFTTRCEIIEFESRAEMLEADADAWLRELWKEAGRRGASPRARQLPGAIVGGRLSYRACVLGLQSRLRAAA